MSENAKKELWSWILHVILPVLIVLLLNLFVCKLAIVKGASMYPTLSDRDLLLVQMLGYEPQQGDIVVLDFRNLNITQDPMLVKRVIALEGQTVLIDYDNDSVSVDGVPLDEPYLNQADGDPLFGYGQQTYTVPEGCIFVMGDNRNHSNDSRSFGAVQASTVLGKSIFRIPFGEWFKAAG